MSFLKTWKHDTWVKPFFLKYKKPLVLTVILGLITYGFAAALMFTSGFLISAAALVPVTVLLIHIPTIYVRIFGVGKPIAQYLERLSSHSWVLRMTSGLRLKLFQSVEKRSFAQLSTQKIGDLLGVLAQDVGQIQNLYLRTVFPTFIAWIIAVLLIALLGWYSPAVAVAVGLSLFVIVVLIPLVSLLQNGARLTKLQATKHQLYEDVTDAVEGLSDWIFSGREDDYQKVCCHQIEQSQTTERSFDRYNRVRDLLMQLFVCASIVFLIGWTSFQFGAAGAGAGGAAAFGHESIAYAGNLIAAFVLGFFPLIEVFMPVASAVTDANLYSGSIQRLNDIEGSKSDFSSFKETLQESCDDKLDLGTVLSDPVINFDQVSFSYSPVTKEVLSSVNLYIAPGEKVALLGKSGAGKSTLAALVHGDRVPTSGELTIGGMHSSTLSSSIHEVVGYIEQAPYLFAASLADNVRLAKKDASDEEVRAALNAVALGSLIESLPQGMDTIIEEASSRFSGGERQRIALARILLTDAPIVILDEPFSSLDADKEAELLDLFLNVLNDRTIILITHHVQGLERMDTVIGLADGGIAFMGSPEDLLVSDPHYQKLVAFDKNICPIVSKHNYK